MSNSQNNAFWCPILLGVALIIAGILIQIPGGALTTHAFLNGETADYYEFDNRYSTIDEYVGGDAYNYIIGATLVAGKMTGMIAAKTICIISGALCVCCGITLSILQKETSKIQTPAEIDIAPANDNECKEEVI